MATAPEPLVYLNGSFLPRRDATLSVEDRGTLFGDGVYEVLRYYFGKPFELQAHMDRFRRSLAGIELAEPADFAQLPAITEELLARSAMPEARVYWQITRGPAARDAIFPAVPKPTVLVMCYPQPPLAADAPLTRCTAALMEDQRWHNCWIKAVTLLPNVLARNRAHAAGHHEAILHRGSTVTEASSANVLAVCDGVLRTHPTNGAILAGVTMRRTLELARQAGINVREEPVSVDELCAAEEVMLTGTTPNIAAVTQVDDRLIAAGQPGPITMQLHKALIRDIHATCGGK